MTLHSKTRGAEMPLRILTVRVAISILCLLLPACSMTGLDGPGAEGRPAAGGMARAPDVSFDSAASPSLDADSLALEIERLIGAERRKYGKMPLQIDPELRKVALLHSRDMVRRNYTGHLSPDGSGPGQRVRKQDRRLFGLTAENVAQVDSSPKAAKALAGEFVREWMNSPRHRQNILSSEFNRTGVGCAQARVGRMDRRRCTQLFATEYAVAEQDVPESVDAGQSVSLRIRAVEGFPPPCRLLQADEASRSEMSSAPLTDSGGASEGRITFQGPPGGYILKIYVPGGMRNEDGDESFLIIPGPYVVVN